MSDQISDTFTITYRKHRCWACGTFYAVEWRCTQDVECPKCAGESIRIARKDRDVAQCAVASLRGIVKRWKARALSADSFRAKR